MQNLDKLRIAIIHDQLTQYGGAEKTLEALLEVFPQADIYTGFCRPINISQKILSQKVFSGKIPGALSFLMPLTFESFDLRPYNLVISEGTAWPKGVITHPDQLHVSYIYTPPRFLYGYSTEGQKRDKWYFKPGLMILDHFLRIWDFNAAQRPDFILTISNEVSKRVQKFYARDSHIIYPPVDLPKSAFKEPNSAESYFLCISRLAAYKNVANLIEAFNINRLPLKIAGTGKEAEKLKKLAGPNIELLGFVNEEKKAELITNCKGFIFPTDYEDFGITVVEALSYGKPVLCHGSGGPLEIVQDGLTGMYFNDLSPENIAENVVKFSKNIDAGLYDSEQAIASSKKFGKDRFKKEFKDFISEKWEEKINA